MYRLAEALGRPAFVTGTGEDWIAYRQARATHRVRGWIAEAYAFGQYFMYSWKKWGYSAATGTLWTEVDPAVFAPLCTFIDAHPDLFDRADNTATVGLLYDNHAADRGHWGVRAASKALLDAGIPYRLVVAGDDLLRQPLSERSLQGIRMLITPDDIASTEPTNRVLDEWRHKGGEVVAAKDAAELAARSPARIEVQTTGRVWALPRLRRASSSVASAAKAHPTPATPTEPPERSRSDTARGQTALIVHLLNRDYVAATDSFERKQALRLILSPSEHGAPATVSHVRYFQPGAEPRELTVVAVGGGRIAVTVPELDLWGIVRFEE